MPRCSCFRKEAQIAPLRQSRKAPQPQMQSKRISWKTLLKVSNHLEAGFFSWSAGDYGLGEISFRSTGVASRSPLGGGCTTRSNRVPLCRCICFFAESKTVPCDPSDVGV